MAVTSEVLMAARKVCLSDHKLVVWRVAVLVETKASEKAALSDTWTAAKMVAMMVALSAV